MLTKADRLRKGCHIDDPPPGAAVSTRYVQICRDIARRVAAGELAPGMELPSVRELAQDARTTTSTTARAYRHLAEHGVVVVGDQRPARVAADGVLAARRLLAGDRVFRLAGSDDPALDVMLRTAGRSVATVGTRGSFQGLTALMRGTADGAAIHLLHRSGVYNAPFARSLLRGRQPQLIHLWRREQGLLIAPGNPRRIQAPADLATLRVAKREVGAGTRVLLDRTLLDAGIAPEQVAGLELSSHLEVALAIASGVADTGLGVRAAANDLDLDFIPLIWESYDIVTTADLLTTAAPLIAALRDPAVQATISDLGGYDLSATGTIEPVA
jgi:molybdate-binding protein